MFAYMYQPNLFSIYTELNNVSLKRMNKVLIRGSIIAVLLYIVSGVFGYLTFVDRPAELMKKSILEADYNDSWLVNLASFSIVFSILVSAPICIKPAKDACMELLFRNDYLSKKMNMLLTVVLVALCYVIALFAPNIVDVLAILGGTNNPLVRAVTKHLGLLYTSMYVLPEDRQKRQVLMEQNACLLCDSEHDRSWSYKPCTIFWRKGWVSAGIGRIMYIIY